MQFFLRAPLLICFLLEYDIVRRGGTRRTSRKVVQQLCILKGAGDLSVLNKQLEKIP